MMVSVLSAELTQLYKKFSLSGLFYWRLPNWALCSTCRQKPATQREIITSNHFAITPWWCSSWQGPVSFHPSWGVIWPLFSHCSPGPPTLSCRNSQYCLRGLVTPRCWTLHLSLLNLKKFMMAYSSSLSSISTQCDHFGVICMSLDPTKQIMRFCLYYILLLGII